MTTQAELTVQEKEAYVRARWIDVYDDGYSVRLLSPIKGWIETPKFSGVSNRWPECYAFTIDRERQIAEVEEEVNLVRGEIRFFQGSPRAKGAMERILTRLQQVLAELRRGMR
jgi:hypothetical protein